MQENGKPTPPPTHGNLFHNLPFHKEELGHQQIIWSIKLFVFQLMQESKMSLSG
jgi:hypothetical protein